MRRTPKDSKRHDFRWTRAAAWYYDGAQGGEYLDGIHFTFAGGQVRSLLSLLGYFGKGENRERYLGLKIPPSLLGPDYVEQAQAFANQLADGLGA